MPYVPEKNRRAYLKYLWVYPRAGTRDILFSRTRLSRGVKILRTFADIFNMIVYLILGITLVHIAVVIYHINVIDQPDG